MKVISKNTVSILQPLLKLYLKLLYGYEIQGIENFCEDGPALVCGNHVTSLDVLFIAAKSKNAVRWMAKDSLFKFPPLAWLILKLGGYPLNKGTGRASAAKTAIRLIQQDQIIGIFPEGHRKKTSEKVGYKIHAGAGMVALETGVKVYPVYISGGERLFKKATLKFGEPFAYPKEEGKAYTYSQYIEVSEDIMKRIYSLGERPGV